mgnify:CR=1 FL=1
MHFFLRNEWKIYIYIYIYIIYKTSRSALSAYKLIIVAPFMHFIHITLLKYFINYFWNITSSKLLFITFLYRHNWWRFYTKYHWVYCKILMVKLCKSYSRNVIDVITGGELIIVPPFMHFIHITRLKYFIKYFWNITKI